MLSYETQADEAGAIYGYLAGFDTLGVARQALLSVYAAYDLDKQLQGYPNLAERQEIAGKSADRLAKLLPLFDAGNLLFLLGRHEEAGRVFDRVAADFPSREILNNAGVARAVEAALLFPKEQLAAAYPWSLDGETRLRLPSPAERPRGDPSPEPPEERRTRLLDEARERLEDAVRRDPGYALALINLACVEELRGRRGTAADLAGSAIDLARRNEQTSLEKLARLARAIAWLHGDRAEEGRKELAALGPPDDPWLRPWTGAAVESRRETRSFAEETVSGARARDVVVPATGSSVTLASLSPSQPNIVVRSKWTASYRAVVVRIGSKQISAVATSSDYNGVSAGGIRLGAPWPSVELAYGAPDRRQPFGSGACALYERPGLIVFTNEEGKVNRWMVYVSP